MTEADLMKQSKPRTTGEVLDRLRRLGFTVTPTMIADDTAAHYLPERETTYRGRAGASGSWEWWMEQRAERLYRLRAVHRRSGGRGPSGDLLRLLLFFADGWGWEYVRDTCVKGYRLALLAAKKGVGNRVRGQELTLENLRTFADDIAEDQYRPKEPNQEQIDRVKMTLGLLMFGAAPDMQMGTIESLMDDLMPGIDPELRREWKGFAPYAWTMLTTGEDDALTFLEGDVSDAVVKRGIQNFSGFMWRVRYGLRKKLFMGKDRPPSTNPLTVFGTAKDFRFHQAMRRMPHRATPAQLVGGQFAQALVIAHGEEQADKAYAFALQWLANFLKSDAFAQWLRHMEDEVKKQP